MRHPVQTVVASIGNGLAFLAGAYDSIAGGRTEKVIDAFLVAGASALAYQLVTFLWRRFGPKEKSE